MVQPPTVGWDHVMFEASRSHSFTHRTFSSIPLYEWSARHRCLYLQNTQYVQEKDTYVPGGFQTRIPSNKATPDPRLRPRHNWNRPVGSLTFTMYSLYAMFYYNLYWSITTALSTNLHSHIHLFLHLLFFLETDVKWNRTTGNVIA
jgi:hypothetical protein